MTSSIVLDSGAARTTTIEQDQMMVDMALKEMNTIIKSIKEFKTLGIDISESTAERRLKHTGLKYTKPLLSISHKQNP